MINDLRIPKKQITFTDKLFDLKEFTQYSNTFIETGTAVGDGVCRALTAGFIYIKTCEAQESLYRQAKKRYGVYENVDLIWEESTDFLKYSVASVLAQRCVIFLDAHPAGPGSYQHEAWIATKENFQHNTILAELEIILNHYNGHVIIIDDVNGLSPESEKYINVLLKANNKYRFYLFDENLSGNNLYKNKILVAIP